MAATISSVQCMGKITENEMQRQTDVITSIKPIALPKGVKKLCELCKKPAFMQCLQCRVTFYCGSDHQTSDWEGIHDQICTQLIPLRSLEPHFSTESKRKEHADELFQQKRQLLQLTRAVGQKLLFEGKAEKAIPAVLQSLHFAIEVYGLSSIELVTSYLMLAEACIGLHRLKEAEDYLSQAQWTVLMVPDCDYRIKSQVHRQIGRLCEVKGDYEEALRHLAEDVYHCSIVTSTDDVETSGGYFHMGNIFLKLGKTDKAETLYYRVLKIWHKYLTGIVTFNVEEEEKSSSLLTSPKMINLGKAQEAEAVKVLSAIHAWYSEMSDRHQLEFSYSCKTQALLNFVIGDRSQAKVCAERALEALGDDEKKQHTRRAIASFLNLCRTTPQPSLSRR